MGGPGHTGLANHFHCLRQEIGHPAGYISDMIHPHGAWLLWTRGVPIMSTRTHLPGRLSRELPPRRNSNERCKEADTWTGTHPDRRVGDDPGAAPGSPRRIEAYPPCRSSRREHGRLLSVVEGGGFSPTRRNTHDPRESLLDCQHNKTLHRRRHPEAPGTGAGIPWSPDGGLPTREPDPRPASAGRCGLHRQDHPASPPGPLFRPPGLHRDSPEGRKEPL